MSEVGLLAMGRRLDGEDAELRHALLRFVDGRLKDRDAGEDIVQETYVRLYDYREKRAVSDVAAFCFTIARNLVHDHFRRRKAAPQSGELIEDIVCPLPRADEILDYAQRVEILVRALRCMPPLRREVFLRRRLDGMSSATISADLDLSISAIEKHCTRAAADLRSALVRRGLPAGAGA